MDYRIDCDKHGLLTVTYSGRLERQELEVSVRDAHATARQKGCNKALVDMRETEMGLRTMEIFDMALGQSTPDFALLRRALVVSHDFGDYSFFENVCRNRSQNVRVFDDVDKATAWLAEDV